jgi:hypothetical protein
VRITPDILISSNAGDSGATPLVSTFLAQMVAENMAKTKELKGGEEKK